MTTHQNKQQHQITHLPVMLAESLQGLKIQPEGCYLDATFGRGGHSAKILEQLSPQGRLIVLDRDPQAIAQARKLAEADRRVDVHYGQFTEIADLLGKDCQLNGVIFDLGISSPQIDQAERGFSFQQSGPLDMRMNNTQGLSAQGWLATADKDEIAWVLSAYGEESYAEKIADQIVIRREQSPLTTTKDLVETVLAAVPTIAKSKHPATRVFQAIRMHINAELDEIRHGIPQAINQLTYLGRL